MRNSLSRILLSAGLSLGMASAITSCGNDQKASDTLVTDVVHSQVKRQSIGNCWLYAASSWAESLHLATTGNEINMSESYWTYWDWFITLQGWGVSDTLNTGGFWSDASNIANKYGYMLEKDFIPEEEEEIRSQRQQDAETFVNEQLKEGGRLATRELRTPETIRAVLDEAFGINMEELRTKAIPINTLVVGKDRRGQDINMYQALFSRGYAWSEVSYPRVYGEDSEANRRQMNTRKRVLKRVMRALNDKQPVVITLMIDFNAWDQESGEFNRATLDEAGEMGRQGGHMIVLEDYTVTNVPGVGDIGEGEVSDELKRKALQGDIQTLITKNSWGIGVNEGYHKFNIDYLDATLGWKRGDSDVNHYTTLGSFHLPPGY